METQGVRRRRSRRRARKKQIALLVLVALAIGVFVWSRILIERRNEAAMFTAAPTTASAAANAPGPRAAKAVAPGVTKNMILFVGNGFGLVPMTATRIYAAGEDGELAIDRFPETAMVRTASRNAQSADSAAAMTAFLTGIRVDNGVLSQTPDTRPYDEAGKPQAAHGETTCPTVGNGKPVTTLLELAKAAGRATGIVTTGRVTQAITAAGYAHLCHRDGENTVAAQLVPGGTGGNKRLGDGLDVILGGGWQHFLPKDDPRGSTRNDSRDLYAEMRAKGYIVIGKQAELAATKQPVGKVLGLFNKGRMNHEADRLGSTEPSLADMTTRAIELLQRNPMGYLLVVEAGRIGEALAGSNARKAFADAEAYDQAIAAALAKVRELDPDLRNTTLVVTADHDLPLIMNGNAALTGRTVEGHPGVLGVLRPYGDPTQVAVDAGGRPYTTLVSAAGGKRVKGARTQAPPINDLVTADRNFRFESTVDAQGALGGNDVLLSAIGANAGRFHGTLDNTQVFTLLRSAMGL